MGIDLDTLMILTLVGMLLAIFSGVHIALALGATAMIGTYFIFEDMYMAASQVGGAAYELIRDHIFMTIPLFVLMGDFLSRSGAAGDLYSLINKGLKGVPGRLGVATVTGNAAFAADPCRHCCICLMLWQRARSACCDLPRCPSPALS